MPPVAVRTADLLVHEKEWRLVLGDNGLPSDRNSGPADLVIDLRAAAYFEIGKMYFADLNDAEKAVDSYQKAFDLLAALAADKNATDKDRGNLAWPRQDISRR